MSVQPVVPATLLEDIKKGLVALGYAHLDTPLSFIQDCYFKYVMVHQVALTKGFSPQIPYAISLLPQAIKDQLGPTFVGILGINNEWGNTGGLFVGPTQTAELTDAYLTDFDYPVTRAGLTDCKQAFFAYIPGTMSNSGSLQEPAMGDINHVNRRVRVTPKIGDFEHFEFVISKANGFPIRQWAKDGTVGDTVLTVPKESVRVVVNTTTGVASVSANGEPSINSALGTTADESTEIVINIRRNPANLAEVTVGISAFNHTASSQELLPVTPLTGLTLGANEKLNISFIAIAKVGKEQSNIVLWDKSFPRFEVQT